MSDAEKIDAEARQQHKRYLEEAKKNAPTQLAMDSLLSSLTIQIMDRGAAAQLLIDNTDEAHLAARRAWRDAADGAEKLAAHEKMDDIWNNAQSASRRFEHVNKKIAATATALSALGRLEDL